MRDQERQLTSQRQLERELHQLQLDESDCKTQLRDKDELERRIEEMKGEIAAADIRLKVGVLCRSRYWSRNLSHLAEIRQLMQLDWRVEQWVSG